MRSTTLLISALCLLVLANVLMMSYASPVFLPSAEGYASYMAKEKEEGFEKKEEDGFQNYSAAGAKDAYQPVGAFDGVRLETGNSSSWRYTSPNEPLMGNYPKFEPGADSLFMFKDNQSKPECCSASYSSNGGCICTTPEQRDYINMRGGNRTSPDAGV